MGLVHRCRVVGDYKEVDGRRTVKDCFFFLPCEDERGQYNPPCRLVTPGDRTRDNQNSRARGTIAEGWPVVETGVTGGN